MNASQPKGWLASVLWNSPGELAHKGHDIKQKNMNEVNVFMGVVRLHPGITSEACNP